MNIDEKKKHYKQEILNIARQSYNDEQKELANYIIDNANEENIDSLYTFITQRIKLGFVYDAAPEVNHNCVALCKKNEDMSFGSLMGQNHKLIIGENYDALKNLLVTYTKNGEGLVDLIYIDPPYNTEQTKKDGNDYKDQVESGKFIYRDKFKRTGWLNMMRERLILARKLLTDKGVIFISIDDTEQAYLKVLCDEIFGENNFYGQLIQLKGNTQNDSKTIQKNHEYILVYSKIKHDLLLTYSNKVKKEVFEDQYYLGRDTGASSGHDKLVERPRLGYTIYYYESVQNGATGNHNTLAERLKIIDTQYTEFKIFNNGKVIKHAIAIPDYSTDSLNEESIEEEIYNDVQELLNLGYVKIRPPKRKGQRLGRWTWQLDTFKELWNKNEILIKNNKNVIKKEFVDQNDITIINNKNYYIKTNTLPIQSIIDINNSDGTTILSGDNGIIPGANFPNPKNPKLIRFLIQSYFKQEDLVVLDFFAGSGTTGQAVMELNAEDNGNRQCILVTNNENNIATDITYERLYRIVNGKGTKGENFNWIYNKDKPYLSNNSWDVFSIEYYDLSVEDYDMANRLLKQSEVEFKKLNSTYDCKKFSIYHQLASLKPYKKEN